MSDKELVLDAVRKMPEQASFAEIVHELALMASLRGGLIQGERGKGMPPDDVIKLLDQWIPK